VWLIGAMVCLLAAPWVQLSVSAGNGWPHNALRHHWLMPISCHFRDCKALLVTSQIYGSGAIASVQTFTFTFYSRQEAQLSQRGRAMIYVNKYFAKSLKVIRNDTVKYGGCKSLLVFRCNYVYHTAFLRHSTANKSVPRNLG